MVQLSLEGKKRKDFEDYERNFEQVINQTKTEEQKNYQL